MKNKWDIIVGKKENPTDFDFNVETFIHDDGHLCISVFVNGCGTVYHFIMKDKSRYNELLALLRLKLNGLHLWKMDLERNNKTLIFNIADEYLNEVIDELFDEYLEDYPEVEEPQMRTEEEIEEYMDEAFDRVWLVRKQNMFCNIADGIEVIDPCILSQCKKAIAKVCNKYNIDFCEPVSDWRYGYWSGILAALRWVTGDEKDFLDT